MNFIKQKICGNIKSRTCTDESPRRDYISREEATSPTISLERLFVSLMIDIHKGRAVQNFDISGTYLHDQLIEDKKFSMKF